MILSSLGILAGKGGIVFDIDAQAFITAAGITDTTQKNAINQLVVDLKANSIYNKFKAIYPFVGGTASSHRFNLKDPRTLSAAFYLDFAGGVTHSSNGVQFDGATGYANTYIVPSSSLSLDSIHVSYYSKSNTTTVGADFGTVGSASYINNIYGYIKYTDNNTYFRLNRGGTPESSLVMSNSNLFYIINRTSSTQESLFRNTSKNTFTYSSTGLSTHALFLGALNLHGTGASSFSNRQTAFVTVGDGLTDAEATALYNAVQTFNTTLARQV